ncbi:MAG: hypothetical protein JWP84_3188 [Tardiphaga sp.]|nr:hypothetical protein [Tardiphaga sp.]
MRRPRKDLAVAAYVALEAATIAARRRTNLSDLVFPDKEVSMPTNKPPPDGHTVGAVKGRSQVKTEIDGVALN